MSYGDSEGNSDGMVSCAVCGECAGQTFRSTAKHTPIELMSLNVHGVFCRNISNIVTTLACCNLLLISPCPLRSC